MQRDKIVSADQYMRFSVLIERASVGVCHQHVIRKGLDVSNFESDIRNRNLKRINTELNWHRHLEKQAIRLQGAGIEMMEQMPEFHLWYQASIWSKSDLSKSHIILVRPSTDNAL